jgi:endonuclease YncB( thermonuclease family)
MPFTLIKGTFHVVHYQPDGDSIRFQADDSGHWEKLDGPAVELNARQHAQLRIEAIDTLETHYKGCHQPKIYAEAALKFLLRGLGIKALKLAANGATVVSAQDGTRGFILSRTTEGNRRPVSFVFAGTAPEADGASLDLTPARLRKSLNYLSVAAGLAYPTYYEGLFPDLRDTFTEAAVAARKANKGLWPRDRTMKGVSVLNLAAVTDRHVVLPKLFRRLVAYLEAGGGIEGFKAYLAKHGDAVFELTNGHSTHLDTFVDVTGHKLRLTINPEQLVFKE